MRVERYLAAALAGCAMAQTADPPLERVNGSYLAAEESRPFVALRPWRKMEIAARDMVAWQPYAIRTFSVLLSQSKHWNPSFGQGIAGYGRRYVVITANRNDAIVLTEGVLPALLGEDPRYFRLGRGPVKHRVAHVFQRTLVTRTDRGASRFNTSGVAGYAISAAIANLYQPDYRSLSETISRTGTGLGFYTLSNAVIEFLPDVKRALKRRRSPDQHDGR